MERTYFITLSSPINNVFYSSEEINLALEFYLFYKVNEIILKYGYYEYFFKYVTINNEKIDLFEKLEDFNELCIRANVSIYFIELIREECRDFIENFENIICHHVIFKNIRNLSFHCFASRTKIVINIEGN